MTRARPATLGAPHRSRPPLYTPEQRARRDATVWTTVQGVLAPVQFLVMLVSSALLLNFLLTGEGLLAATVSVIVKTAILLLIMVTGSIWEKVVFDEWLFADAFFWEDVVSFGVIALHLVYVLALVAGWAPTTQAAIALVAYAAYAVNAIQFILKLRAARLQEAADRAAAEPAGVPA
ncbi:MAG TPA: 2-vinyl bacteriochlorophyllide hydratase [Paracoccaceae bacterium]|nr:2-vinyl bacteriochlorophyllide hydratase [Paracoccaceae bacterium]